MLDYLVFFAINAGIFAILALGLNLQWGYTGLFNIGIAGFFAIGAYASALLSGVPPAPLDWRTVGGLGLPFGVGLIGAAVISGIVALFIGIPTLRLKEDYLAIATIGIAEVIRLLIKNETWLTNGDPGIKHIPQPMHRLITSFIENYNWFYLILIFVVLAMLYLAIERAVRAPWGRVLKAIREDEMATAMSGKNVFGFKLQSLVLGAMIMGIAGSLFAHHVKTISPGAFEPFFATFLIWVMLIAGGSGNNKGAILGAFVIWGIWVGTDFLIDFLPGLPEAQAAALRVIAIGLLLELILLLRPRGLLGEEKRVSKLI